MKIKIEPERRQLGMVKCPYALGQPCGRFIDRGIAARQL